MDAVALRMIRVRYADTCSVCGAPVAAKASAWWDGETRAMTCEGCGPSSPTVPVESARPASPAELPAQALAQQQPAEPPSATKALKLIKVRLDGSCVDCECPVPAGSSAWWETATKTLRCPACAGFAGIGARTPTSATGPVAAPVALGPEAAPAANRRRWWHPGKASRQVSQPNWAAPHRQPAGLHSGSTTGGRRSERTESVPAIPASAASSSPSPRTRSR